MAKKPEIVIPEALLAKFPEEEQAAIKAEIAEAFENFDPNNPPGEVVVTIPHGPAICPECKVSLEHVTTVQIPESRAIDIFDCPQCDKSYERDALN